MGAEARLVESEGMEGSVAAQATRRDDAEVGNARFCSGVLGWVWGEVGG